MMCNIIARTNWSNIESNYFMHSIIVRNLPYYMNVMITVTFINQVTLGHTFFLFLPKNYPQKAPVPSSKLICTCLTCTRKFLTAPTSFTMWSGQPSFKTNRLQSCTVEWIIFTVTGISVCSPLCKLTFTAVMLDGFLFGRSFHSFFLDLDHCSIHLLQPLWSTASSCRCRVCHQQLGQLFHLFFLDLV